MSVLARSSLGYSFSAVQVVGRLGILPPVLKLPGQMVQRIGAAAGLRIVGHLLVNPDVVELVRELEPLHARGQPGNRLVLAQGIQRVGPAGVLLAVVAGHAAESPAELRHRLHAELLLEEIGELHPHLVGPLGVELDRLLETPSPALAVVLGLVPVLGDAVEDGLAVRIDRGPLDLPAAESPTPPPAPALFIIGQHAQVGLVLQPPRLLEAAIVQEHVGQGPQETGNLAMLVVVAGVGHGLRHQLQRPDAVAGRRIDPAPVAAAVRAAREFARHDDALLRHLHVLLSDVPEE